MYKAIIIDDEYIVRQGLKALVEWEQYGIQLIGEADNGLKGMEIIKDLKPDIVFTDIRMPGLNGLDLIERTKSLIPEAVFVIFSGYNDFEYARTALRLGVVDYIDKPVTIEKINKSIKTSIQSLKQRKEQNNLNERMLERQRDKIVRLLNELINGHKINQEYLIDFCQEHEVDLLALKQTIVGVGTLEDIAGITVQYLDQIKDIFYKICIENNVLGFFIKSSSYFTMILIEFSESSHGDIMEIFRKIINSCNIKDIEISLGIGNCYYSFNSIYDSYNEARKALRYTEFLNATQGLICFSEVEYNYSLPIKVNKNHDSIIYNIRSGNKKEVISQVKEFLVYLKSFNLSPDIFCRECLELIYIGIKVTKETGNEFSLQDDTEFIPHVYIMSLKSFEEIYDWMIEVFDQIVDFINTGKDCNNKQVLIVKNYLDENYHKDITLNELAEIVRMSSTYLSMLFKKCSGTTYVKYLANLRVEKAKELLKQGLKVYEVSEKVGYHNFRHFCDVFKKHVGMTPEQYKHS